MAMLAEPRRKQKISVNPQGTNWSNDESKFGQKMLERMGWNKGQGLGADGTGRVDHVKISFKDDQRGVGCTKNNADNWISHQDDFNSLLESLNEGHGDGVDNSNTEKIACLEKKSQTSKKRVHYSKFTRGKDLSSRSNADLDCIFGKRKSKKTGSGESTPTVQLECPETEDTKEDHSHGFNTIKSTSTVQEYFAKKMAALKGQNVTSTDSNTETLEEESCTNNNSNEKKKKKKKKSKRKEVEEVNDEDSKGDNSVMENADVESRTNVESDVVEVPEKRTKKSKKSKRKDIQETVEENEPPCKNVKSKKKKKLKEVNDSVEPQVDSRENIEEEVTKKKSKKRKREECAEEDNSPEVEEENVLDKKRRKKDKKTRLDDATSATSSQKEGATLTSKPKISRTTLTHYLRKKKSQKSKLHPFVKSVCMSFKGANVASIVGYDKSSMSQAEMLYKISVKHGYALQQMK